MKLLFIAIVPLLIITGCEQHHSADVYNHTASLQHSIPEAPLTGNVITSMADQRHHTMSTLYGNTVAAAYARSYADGHYPAGAVLTLVTWRQQEDKHWYGANIPDTIRSIAQVVFPSATSGAAMPTYTYYQGYPLQRTTVTDSAWAKDGITYITQLKASVMP